MQSGPRLRHAVLAARENLAAGRSKLKAQHQRGSPGIQVCTRLTELVDRVVLEIYQGALESTVRSLDESVALVALGGYGRRDVAPFSDVDLMVLYRGVDEQQVAPLARILTRDICDAGLQLGFSLRTPYQACAMAMGDATIFTALAEGRCLAGSEPIFDSFMGSFRRKSQRRSSAIIDRIIESRRGERRQYGETVYLLEPNVKRSKGALRDVQLLRWIGFARYGDNDPEALVRLGVLSKEDGKSLRAAHDFLLRLRNEMHFQAGRAQDLLSRDEQLRISELFGYQGNEIVLPVERFLREYIEHTSQVRYHVAHFVAGAKSRVTVSSVVRPLFSHHVEGDYRVDPVLIRATRRGLEKLRTDLVEVLRLMDLSNRYGNRIDHKTWVAVRDAMINRSDLEMSPGASERFLSLMSQPGRLGELLHRLHELRVLEKLVPAMAHARGLMQFNDYHKYTVDEHSIRAVECATGYLTEPGSLGEAYRGIKDKTVLHLALLLHDLGKGFADDHSDVGRKLAAETAELLGLNERDTENLLLLVHKHLLMSHLAQRRDIHDDSVVAEFAAEMGSLEILQMMYVLTCADLAAVGPGTLNSWRRDVITRLYHRTRRQLAGDASSSQSDEWDSQRRSEIRELAGNAEDPAWWDQHIAALPPSYLAGVSPQHIVEELRRMRCLAHNDAAAWGRYCEERKATEYTVGTYEEITPGIFHKLTGALSSKGLKILSAEIHTLADQMVLDRFYVSDMDHAGAPPVERVEEVSCALINALKTPKGEQPTFRRLWAAESRGSTSAAMRLPTQVRVDNSSSDRYTILDIFAHDRMGLLFTITRNIFELGLSVHIAKIGTYLDQVVDVFYVTDQKGVKIGDDFRLYEIRMHLKKEIEAFTSAEINASSNSS